MTDNVKKQKSWVDSWSFLILFCILLPLALRSFFYAPFHIPSGSMKPTLLVGDYLFVSKFAYGYTRYSMPFSPALFEGRIFTEGRAPARGDVVVFRLPSNTSIDYVKRLIGLPGDRIQVLSGELYLNGQKLSRIPAPSFTDSDGAKIPAYVETLPNGVSYTVLDQQLFGPLDNTPEYVVPPKHYFMMGDNRDNSQDSRVLSLVGYVPEENLVGRADIVFFSLKYPFLYLWKWIDGLRPERTLQKIR